jgi:CIC family chloride channel protein
LKKALKNMVAKISEKETLKKWVLIGVTVGIIAGLGAIAFYTALKISSYYLLGRGAGFFPPKPGVGPDVASKWTAPRNPYMLVLIMTMGGLLSGLIIYSFAPEAEGHGTDAAIRSFHREGGRVRARIPLIKTIASAITIGSGGSAGREGPTAQISAGFGSLVASLLKLSPEDRRLAVAVGVGAGIGSIFKAPLGGAILAAEILYIRDIEKEAIIPSLIASTIGYIIFCSYEGYEPIFILPKTSIAAIHIPFFILLGLVCGIVGLIYVFTFYKTHEVFSSLFKRMNMPLHFKPALGAFIGSLIVVFFIKFIDPRAGLGAVGMGYGFLQLAMFNLLPWQIMFLIAIVKILTTSLTIGSGGSGGVFAPGLVIGGSTGGAVGMLLHQLFPSLIPLNLVPVFVGVGMVSLFGGVSKAPIANMIMISEMTNNYMLLFPSMAAVFVSYLVTGKHTIYIEQVETRIDSPAHIPETLLNVLRKIKVRDVMVPMEKLLVVSKNDRVTDVFGLIEKTGYMGFPVVENGNLAGIITFEDIKKVPNEKRGVTTVSDVMTRDVVVTYPDETLETVLIKLIGKNIGRLIVIEEGDRRIIGLVTKKDVIKALTSSFADLISKKTR